MTKKSCKTNDDRQPTVHIRISDKGEICVWGLEQEYEKQLLILTGNRDLSELCESMSFTLCG